MIRDEETVTPTPIGVDLGEHTLYAACPAGMPDWKGAYAVCGEDVCTQLDELRKQTAALLISEFDRDSIVAYIQKRRDEVVETIDDAAHEICQYASAYDQPLLVTEDSHYNPDLWKWVADPDAHRGTVWLLPTAHHRLRSIAAEYAIAVQTVPAVYSSQECHACGVLGDPITNKTFRCTNPACHVGTVYADYNSAKVLAERFHPGRSCAYRPEQPPASESTFRSRATVRSTATSESDDRLTPPLRADGGSPD